MVRRAPGGRQPAVEDDEEIEQGSSQPLETVKVKSEKKAKGKGKGKSRREREGDDGDVDEEQHAANREDQEDIAMAREIASLLQHFKDQPVSAFDGAEKTLTLQAQDWSDILEPRQFEDVMTAYNRTSLLLQGENDPTDAEVKAVTALDDALRELIDAEAIIKAHAGAITSIKQSVQANELEENPATMYKRLVNEAEAEFEKKTTRQKYGKDARYQKFKEGVWEAGHPDTAMDPLLQTMPREDGDESDDDDEILVGGRVQDYKCPITLTILVEPVTSTKCPHSYSKAAMAELFQQTRGGATGGVRCPATGCTAMLTRSDVRPNKDMEFRVKQFVRREQKRTSQMQRDERDRGDVEDVEDILDDDDDDDE